MGLVKRSPGAGRPKKYGEPTRSIRVPESITTEQIMAIRDLQTILDHWEEECAAAGEGSARHHFLKQCLEEVRALGY